MKKLKIFAFICLIYLTTQQASMERPISITLRPYKDDILPNCVLDIPLMKNSNLM